MVEVRVLLVGKHEKIPEGMYASSTVTLIKANDVNILVDSGSFADRGNLITALKNEGLTLTDIHTVVVTHLHLDHTANLDLFTHAAIITKHSAQSAGLMFHGGSNIITSVNVEHLEIVSGVKIILTPGHVDAHISVVVETSDGTYVICGDAIQTPDQVDVHTKPKKACDIDAFENSRNLILGLADYLIPGHGGVIQIRKKNKRNP